MSESDAMERESRTARMLRPELVQIEGFVDSVATGVSPATDGSCRYRRGATKALVCWPTKIRHHQAQEKGRVEILADYRLRVGQVMRDTHVPAGHGIQEQRLDETEVAEATTAVLLDGKRTSHWVRRAAAYEVADWLGGARNGDGLVSREQSGRSYAMPQVGVA